MIETLKSIPKASLIIYVLLASLALITLKVSAAGGAPIALTEGVLTFNINTLTVLGLVLYGCSFLLYLYLLSKFNLGYVVPITTGMIYFIVFISSFVVFHEVFSMVKLAGIGAIFVGLILLNKA